MVISFSEKELFFIEVLVMDGLDTVERLFNKGEAEIWAAEEGISVKEAEKKIIDEVKAYKRILEKLRGS